MKIALIPVIPGRARRHRGVPTDPVRFCVSASLGNRQSPSKDGDFQL